MLVHLIFLLVACCFTTAGFGKSTNSYQLDYSCDSEESLSIYLKGPGFNVTHMRTLHIKSCSSLAQSLSKGPQKFQHSISIAYCYQNGDYHLKALKLSSDRRTVPLALRDVVTEFSDLKSCLAVSDILNEGRYDVWSDAIEAGTP